MRVASVGFGLALVVLPLALGAGCHSADKASTDEARELPAAKVEAKPAAGADRPETKKFGETVPAGPALTLATVLSSPEQYADKAVTIEAKVRRNCTRKGCWMELSEALDPALPGCRVTFKDYGFFVPLDSAGSTARVQGVVEVETVAAPEVAHLESEGAKFAAKQPDGTAREVRVIASGVELWKERG
jgi:hypothetical protein